MNVRILRPIFALFLMLFVLPSHADDSTLRFRHMFVLGDSLSDQGNLLSATTELAATFNSPPIPATDHYFDGRFSNGENYAGILARKLGFTSTASQLGGGNYAFGGARTNYNRVELRPGVPPPLPNGIYPIGAYPWSLDLERGTAKLEAPPAGLEVEQSRWNSFTIGLPTIRW